MDPFVDLIRLLRPRATLWGGLEGSGRWGLAFRKRDDLVFCWVERGACLLTRPGCPPVDLKTDDFALIRSASPFRLTTDPAVPALDSEVVAAATNSPTFRFGDGEDSPVTLRAGRFVFDTANEDMLTGLLPSLIHIAASNAASPRLRLLLGLNESEFREPGPGGEFVLSRLMELILVEILRSQAMWTGEANKGLLAGLADRITLRALSAMHADIASDWTVARLARLSGLSRSSFAARFREIVGMGPIEYLLSWRMALAKDELRKGTRGIGEIAFAIGFKSPSAFSTAFSKSVGCSPKRFAERTMLR